MISRGFKGLKQAIKLEFKLGRYSDVGLILMPPMHLNALLIGLGG